MKKLLLLLFVTALFQVNAQISPSNPVTDTFIIACQDYNFIENAIVVPEGEFWIVCGAGSYWRFTRPNSDIKYGISLDPGEMILTEGCSIFYDATCWGEEAPIPTGAYLGILVYNHSTSEALSYNDVEPLKDRIKLFPNPTTNQLALNSDKVYQIEVFDLAGNKVMELKGNTISVEHLSSATYIVNAIDLETKESLSYKVVKK